MGVKCKQFSDLKSHLKGSNLILVFFVNFSSTSYLRFCLVTTTKRQLHFYEYQEYSRYM